MYRVTCTDTGDIGLNKDLGELNLGIYRSYPKVGNFNISVPIKLTVFKINWQRAGNIGVYEIS